MSEWKKYQWGDIATLEYGKAVNYKEVSSHAKLITYTDMCYNDIILN